VVVLTSSKNDFALLTQSLVCLAGTLLTADETRASERNQVQKFAYRKEVETVMPANEDAAGSGSLYCFVTETSKKVTL